MTNQHLIINAAGHHGYGIHRISPYETVFTKYAAQVIVKSQDLVNYNLTWIDSGKITLQDTVSAEDITELF